jgi:hypothetical protein
MYLQKVVSKKNLEKNIHLEGHGRKEQDPEPDPDPLVRYTNPRIRIYIKMHGSGTLPLISRENRIRVR